MSAAATLRVCALYPSRMNIYADRGNMILLEWRCAARGIGFELAAAEEGDTLDPAAHDFFYIGGGQDRDQEQIAEDMLATKRAALAEAVDDGAVVLAVCGGYQLLGEYYELAERRIPGLSLVDLRTVREPGARLIGNVMIETEAGGIKRRLAGFENHGGRTYLGDSASPLGTVLAGHGNNGKDGFEGVRHNNLFGTYLHGPLLPKNAWFADFLTSLALERGGYEPALAPLDDTLEEQAHACAAEAALRSAPRSGRAARKGASR